MLHFQAMKVQILRWGFDESLIYGKRIKSQIALKTGIITAPSPYELSFYHCSHVCHNHNYHSYLVYNLSSIPALSVMVTTVFIIMHLEFSFAIYLFIAGERVKIYSPWFWGKFHKACPSQESCQQVQHL